MSDALEEGQRRVSQMREVAGISDDIAAWYPLGFEMGAEWQKERGPQVEITKSERVREWAVANYCSGTPLDQDRRMVAAETEAFLSGRTGRETSELTQRAKYAGPVDDEKTCHDRRVDAMMTALADTGLAPRWWGGTEFRRASEALVNSQEEF